MLTLSMYKGLEWANYTLFVAHLNSISLLLWNVNVINTLSLQNHASMRRYFIML